MTSSATRDARTADYSQHSKADLVQLLAHVLGDDANAIKKLSKGDLIANLAMKMDCPSGDFEQWIVDDRENQDAVMEEEKKAADATAVENYLAENGDDEEESDKSDDEEKPAKVSKKHKADVEREAPNRKKAKVDSVEKKSDSLAKKKASASIFGSESKSSADGTDELGEAEPMVPLGIISSFVALLYFVARTISVFAVALVAVLVVYCCLFVVPSFTHIVYASFHCVDFSFARFIFSALHLILLSA